MKIKEIEIEWEGKKGIVKLKRLTFGEMNQLTEDATNITVVNGQPVVKVSQKILKEMGLLKSITEAPFTTDINFIRNLDNEIGNLLFEEFTELNQQSLKKNA